MDEQTVDQWLASQGIAPGHPSYAAFKQALLGNLGTLGSLQGREIKEDTRRWDITSGQAQARIDREYEIASRAADTASERLAVERWKADQDAQIAREQNQIRREQLALDRELGMGRLDVERGAQGLGLLRTDVDLNSQVRNWAKVLDWRRGVAENPQAPAFIRSLLSNAATNTSLTPRQGVPVGMPEQNSLAAVLRDMGITTSAADQTNAALSQQSAATQAAPQVKPEVNPAQVGIQAMSKAYTPSAGSGWDTKDVAFLNAIGALAAQGTHKSANRVAQLDVDEQQALAGGMDRLGVGGDWWLRQSERDRIGEAQSPFLA